jgi:choline dehydrogenase-like flavoprotein
MMPPLMIRDASELRNDETLEFDLVIIGGGMAGITLAEKLRSGGRRICLLEGGGEVTEVESQRLLEGVNVGLDYFSLDRCRARVLGGASTRWGGWCRPFDELDFEQRDEVPLSGWPISYGEVSRYYSSAAELLGLDMATFELANANGWLPDLAKMAMPELVPGVIQIQGPIDFGALYRTQLSKAETVTAILHANVSELRTAPGGDNVEYAIVRRPGGGDLTVHGRAFVLATGGIENARLLLASQTDRPAGLGNETDFVGRCFTETINAPVGHAELTVRPSQAYPLMRRRPWSRTGSYFVFGTAESAARRRRLPSCALSLDAPHDLHGWTSVTDWTEGLDVAITKRKRYVQAARYLRTIMKHRLLMSLDTRRNGAAVQAHKYVLYVRAEQTPNTSSRVSLDDSRDYLGMRRPRLDWRVADSDLDAITEWVEVFASGLRQSGSGRFLGPIPDWRDRIIGGPHHKGTTRMSSAATTGVVDANCRVHTVSNLYVAGSSVFPSGGYANPSLTILAMAIRLADHLRDRL